MVGASQNSGDQSLTCPHCNGEELSWCGRYLLYCPRCESIFGKQASSGLERLNVEPVRDLTSYPEVIVEPTLPYCDCQFRELIETAGTGIGPHFCSRHNAIVLQGLYGAEDLEALAESAIYIINHETIHWILSKDFGESTSSSLDNVPVSACC